MLDHVGDVGLGTVDAGLLQRPVEQLARRPDERPALQILLIARLLADQHHTRARSPLAEHRLRTALVQRAGGAAGGSLLQLVEVRLRRHEPARRVVRLLAPRRTGRSSPAPSDRRRLRAHHLHQAQRELGRGAVVLVLEKHKINPGIQRYFDGRPHQYTQDG